jgi:hypothetical protein
MAMNSLAKILLHEKRLRKAKSYPEQFLFRITFNDSQRGFRLDLGFAPLADPVFIAGDPGTPLSPEAEILHCGGDNPIEIHRPMYHPPLTYFGASGLVSLLCYKVRPRTFKFMSSGTVLNSAACKAGYIIQMNGPRLKRRGICHWQWQWHERDRRAKFWCTEKSRETELLASSVWIWRSC